MRVRLVPTLVTAGVLALTAGCAEVGDAVDEARASAQQLSNDARFCLAVARAASSVESGASQAALDAAEEALTHAPAQFEADARMVAQRLRDGFVPEDAHVNAVIDDLRSRARDLCLTGAG